MPGSGSSIENKEGVTLYQCAAAVLDPATRTGATVLFDTAPNFRNTNSAPPEEASAPRMSRFASCDRGPPGSVASG